MQIKHKIMAITPMLCLIAFLLLGFVWGKWHPGWLVFVLVPIMPVILGMKKIKVSIPTCITIIYLIMGFGFDLWHPGWIIFLFIPVLTTLLAPTKKKAVYRKDDDIVYEETKS